MTTLLVTTQKDEGQFILEWAAYHHVIGFDQIWVFSNGCSDGSEELLDALAHHGLVRHSVNNLAPEESPQGLAGAQVFSSDLYRKADWIGWLDMDEFLNIHCGNHSLSDLTKELGDASGIFMNWRVFGDSNMPNWSGGLVLPQFLRAARAGNHENDVVKALFRPAEHISALYHHRPYLTDDFIHTGAVYLDTNGDPVPVEMAMGLRNHGRPVQTLHPSGKRFRLAQVNHYAVKTYDLFSHKRKRGGGAKAIGLDPVRRQRRYREKYWIKRNRNEVEDRSILRHLDDVKAKMAQWLALPGVAEAHQACHDEWMRRLETWRSQGDRNTG